MVVTLAGDIYINLHDNECTKVQNAWQDEV